MNILPAFKKINWFIFDIDGVLTDSTILVMDNGEQVRRMNIKDGYALQLAVKKGYSVVVVSGASESAAKQRLERLGIRQIHFGIISKAEFIKNLISSENIEAEQVLFMGDDIPDLDAMKYCGLSCCPSDAASEIRETAQYISHIPGGQGCVRDVIEKVLKLNNHWLDTTVTSS